MKSSGRLCLIATAAVICSTCSAFGGDIQPKSLVAAFEARGDEVCKAGGFQLTVTSRGAVLSVSGHLLRLHFLGGSFNARLEGLDRFPGGANYFGAGGSHASFAIYREAVSRGIYPGIDIVFRANSANFEYDFEIGADSDPDRIQLEFEGAGEVKVDPNGDLILRSGLMQFRQPRPAAWQIVKGRKVPVDVSYRIEADKTVRLTVGPHQRELPLVIDPQVVFDNSFGGSGISGAAAIRLDKQGNIYVAGQTGSADLPLRTVFTSGGPSLASDNGGAKWSFPALSTATTVTSIAAAPSDASVIYAATDAGIWKSGDAGSTWKLLSGLPSAPVAVSVDAGSSSLVYALTVGGIFVSTDGGTSWRLSNNGIQTSDIFNRGQQQMRIAANPYKAGTVFVLTGHDDGNIRSNIYRSTDAGNTWVPLGPELWEICRIFCARGTCV